MSMEGEFSRYLEDVYSAEPVEREALSESVMFWCWRRFAGLCFGTSCARLVSKCALCEKGGDGRHLVLEPLPGHRL